MQSKWQAALLIFMGVGVGTMATIGQSSLADSAPPPARPNAADQLAGAPVPTADSVNTAIPLDDLRRFVEILNRVKQGYVGDISDKKLLDNAMHGMVDGLDPHSAYLDADEFKQLTVSTTGQFGGLGLKVQMDNGYLKVVAPIDDTPASRAGIQPGDLIVRVDDKPVKGMPLAESIHTMRGKAGTSVSLTLVREGQDQPIELTLERADIQVESVKSRLLAPGYGYIRITQFTGETAEGMTHALDTLTAKGPLKGLVLDLRNNPGGILDAAVDVVDDFVDSGTIVSIKGRAADINQDFKATDGDRLNGAPIVALVNQGSASAAEIVAGALQDDHRAVIMGQRTFGKGSVQTVIPLADGAALKITTARYYTPSGRSIQAEGIEPDVVLQPVKITAQGQGQNLFYSEADLPGALKNSGSENAASKPSKSGKAPNQNQGQGHTDESQPTRSVAADADAKAGQPDETNDASTQHDTAKSKDAQPLASTDYGLYEALNLLKGLNTLSQRASSQAPSDSSTTDVDTSSAQSAPDKTLGDN